MRIGVDYYPEHWDESVWVADADAMKKLGVTTVRMAEFAWSRMEPEEGKYDFAWLDRAVDLFEERGIEVVLCTPTNTPPLWLYEKYPECIQVDKSGHRIPIGIRGHRCLTSPVFRTLAEKMIRAMLSHYSSRKNVIAWQIDNELEANHCCCEYCENAFRNWVQKKYGTIEKVNAAYGNHVWSGEYNAFSQVRPPFGEHQTWMNPAYMLDFNRYASDSTVEYVKWQTRLIHEICPGIPVTTNNWLCEHMPDFYQMFEDLDFVSYDNYPTTNIPTNPEEVYSHAFHLDLMRGIKRQNFWIMEQLSGMLGSWAPMSRTPYPGMIQGYTLQAIAHGADAVLHFRWRTAKSGAEMFWHGLMDATNVPGRRMEEFATLCENIKALQCVNETVVENKVAILYSSAVEYAFKIQPQVDGMHYFTQLKLFHDGFTNVGVGVDIINEHACLDNYKIVIAPTMFVVETTVSEKLEDFAKNGGTVVLTNRSGVKDTHNNCIMQALPTVYSHMAGVVVKEYDAIGYARQQIEVSDLLSKREKHMEMTAWADILEIKEEAKDVEILAKYAENFYAGMPAVTRNAHGKGKVYYVGTILSRAFYKELAKCILAEKGIPFIDNLSTGVEVTERVNEEKIYRFVFNNSDKEKPFELEQPMWNVLLKKAEHGNICLKPFQMAVYCLERQR